MLTLITVPFNDVKVVTGDSEVGELSSTVVTVDEVSLEGTECVNSVCCTLPAVVVVVVAIELL